jgi:hypothetical protein
MVGQWSAEGELFHVGQQVCICRTSCSRPTAQATYGLRVDVPVYFTDPVDNAYSRGLKALDENDRTELSIRADCLMPNSFSRHASDSLERIGRAHTTQIRGGTGVFTGRVPFVWLGNVISNPGSNPKLPPSAGAE